VALPCHDGTLPEAECCSYRGHVGAPTVNGTTWLTRDSCKGTFFQAMVGSVTVADFPHHRTFVLQAPHGFLVRPGKGG
jgi:hypothetical protein